MCSMACCWRSSGMIFVAGKTVEATGELTSRRISEVDCGRCEESAQRFHREGGGDNRCGFSAQDGIAERRRLPSRFVKPREFFAGPSAFGTHRERHFG